MSKFCTKCGATLDDNAAFCTTCGTKFNVAASAPAKDDSNATILDKFKANANAEGLKKLQANPKFTMYVGIGAAAIAAIIILVLVFSLFGGAWKKPIENYYKGIEKKDGEIFMSAYHELQLKSEKKKYDWSASEQEKEYKSSAKGIYSYLKEEYGNGIKLSVKYEDKEKIDKDDLKDYEEFLQLKWDKKSLEVTKGYEVEGIVKVKGDDDKDELDFDYVVLKIDGDWAIVDYDYDYVKEYLDEQKDKDKDDDDDDMDIAIPDIDLEDLDF